MADLHSLMLAAGVVLSGLLAVNLGRRWQRYGVARRGVLVFALAILGVHRRVAALRWTT